MIVFLRVLWSLLLICEGAALSGSGHQDSGVPGEGDVVVLRDGTVVCGQLLTTPSLEYSFGAVPIRALNPRQIFLNGSRWEVISEDGELFAADCDVEKIEIKTLENPVSFKIEEIAAIHLKQTTPENPFPADPRFTIQFSGDQIITSSLRGAICLMVEGRRLEIHASRVVELIVGGGIRGEMFTEEGVQAGIPISVPADKYLPVEHPGNRQGLNLLWSQVQSVTRLHSFSSCRESATEDYPIAGILPTMMRHPEGKRSFCRGISPSFDSFNAESVVDLEELTEDEDQEEEPIIVLATAEEEVEEQIEEPEEEEIVVIHPGREDQKEDEDLLYLAAADPTDEDPFDRLPEPEPEEELDEEGGQSDSIQDIDHEVPSNEGAVSAEEAVPEVSREKEPVREVKPEIREAPKPPSTRPAAQEWPFVPIPGEEEGEILSRKVTNKQYEKFVRAVHYKTPSHWVGGKIPKGQDSKPVVNVSYRDAYLFSLWSKNRLPTVEELRAAAEADGVLEDQSDGLNEWTSTPHMEDDDWESSRKLILSHDPDRTVPLPNDARNARTGFRVVKD